MHDFVIKKYKTPNGLHVYIASFDGRLTKYITKSEWDGTFKMQARNGDMHWYDSHGDTMLVFEDDEDEFHEY